MNKQLLHLIISEKNLCSSIYDAFMNGKISLRCRDIGMSKYLFGSDDLLVNTSNVKKSEMCVEDIYLDFETFRILFIVISLYDVVDELQYCLAIFDHQRRTFNINFCNKNIERISINETIISADSKTNAAFSLSNLTTLNDISYKSENGTYCFSGSILEESIDFLPEFLSLKCEDYVSDKNKYELPIVESFRVDLNDLFNPKIIEIYLILGNDYIVFSNIDDCVSAVNDFDNIAVIKNFNIFEELSKKAIDDLKQKVIGTSDLAEYINSKNLDLLFDKYKDQIEINGDSVFFSELEDFPLIKITNSSIKIIKSRNPVNDDFDEFNLSTFNEEKEKIYFAIDKLLKQEAIRLTTIKDFCNLFSDEMSLEERTKYADKFNVLYAVLKDYERNDTLVSRIYQKVQKISQSLSEIRYDLIEKTKLLIRDLTTNDKLSNDEYQKMSDSLYDLRDFILSDYEKEVLKNDFDKYFTVPDPVFAEEEKINHRKVFISNKALKQFDGLSLELKSAIIEILSNCKSLPGLEYCFYLKSLQLNHPYGVHKIRINNLQPYRLCFYRGKDLNDRVFNENSLYVIGFIEDHDNDIKKLANEKPATYQINDFEIFPYRKEKHESKLFSKNLKELSRYQYEIAANHKGPVVTYGCAGSGKTLVSIEQYIDLAWNEIGSNILSKADIAYITFNNELCKKANDSILQYETTSNCYSLIDYFIYIGNQKDIQPKQIADERVFISWYKKFYTGSGLKKYNRRDDLKGLEDVPDLAPILYTYYRGVYKGDPILLETGERHLNIEEFINSMGQEKYLSKERKTAIFNLCERFYTYASENELFDDNDLAFFANQILKTKDAKKVKYIIVDEVQDLTNLQIQVIVNSLRENSTNIFFYGDPHQTINPALFTEGSISGAVHNAFSGKNIELKTNNELAFSYRTNSNLKNYLVFLQNKRTNWLKHYFDGLAQVDSPIEKNDESSIEESAWAGVINNQTIAKYAIRQTLDSARAIIIVPDENTKLELIDSLDVKKNKDRILTIFDAKGQEWDNAILYHMLKSNERFFIDMIDGRAEKSTMHRMCFNKFYVACTRSVKSFICVEDDLNINIFENLLSQLAKIESIDQCDLYLSQKKSTYEDWLAEGQRFSSADMLQSARNAYANAYSLANTDEQKRLVQKLIRSLKTGNQENVEDAINYLNAKDYRMALALFGSNRKNLMYSTLCRVLLDVQITDKKMVRSLINSNLLDKYPEVYSHLMKQQEFLNIIAGAIKAIGGH